MLHYTLPLPSCSMLRYIPHIVVAFMHALVHNIKYRILQAEVATVLILRIHSATPHVVCTLQNPMLYTLQHQMLHAHTATPHVVCTR